MKLKTTDDKINNYGELKSNIKIFKTLDFYRHLNVGLIMYLM